MASVIITIFIIASISFPVIDSACVAYTREAPTSGKPVSLDCVYRDDIRIPVDRSFLDLNRCLECHCKMSALECCGMENDIDTFVIPGCKIIKGNCTHVYVDENDPDMPCPYDASTDKMAEGNIMGGGLKVTADPLGKNNLKNNARYLYSNGIMIPLSFMYQLMHLR